LCLLSYLSSSCFLYIVVSNTYCVVFLLYLSSSCFLYIVVSNTYCVVFLLYLSLSCFLYIVVSNTCCVFGCCLLRRLYPMLPLYLDCPFLIAPLVLSNVNSCCVVLWSSVTWYYFITLCYMVSHRYVNT
jgi:hypothetical protein